MLRISPNSSKSFLLQWPDMNGDFFQVLRSTSVDSGYEILANDLTVPVYVDETVNLHDTGRRYYYKIKSFEGGVVVGETGGATTVYNPRHPIANKVIYESQVVLKAMNNPPVKILLKRRSGKRCPECWNTVTNRPRFANCTTCNGTGVIGGYHEPIETRISRSFSQLYDNSSALDGDKVRQTDVDAWISNVPLISPGDVIADAMNQRFLIESVTQRTFSQYIIRQLLTMTPLEKGHPAYEVNLVWSDPA